jgi:hypothetical protein
MFVLGVLSFVEAKPRNASVLEYEEKDEFSLADFVERLRFVRGALHFDADYIRGRQIKTRTTRGTAATCLIPCFSGRRGCMEPGSVTTSEPQSATDQINPIGS